MLNVQIPPDPGMKCLKTGSILASHPLPVLAFHILESNTRWKSHSHLQLPRLMQCCDCWSASWHIPPSLHPSRMDSHPPDWRILWGWTARLGQNSLLQAAEELCQGSAVVCLWRALCGHMRLCLLQLSQGTGIHSGVCLPTASSCLHQKLRAAAPAWAGRRGPAIRAGGTPCILVAGAAARPCRRSLLAQPPGGAVLAGGRLSSCLAPKRR